MTKVIKLRELVSGAVRLAGGNLCEAGHQWVPDGGARACPLDLTDGCSQAVYRCARCGEYDYGEPGGPGEADCVATCGWFEYENV